MRRASFAGLHAPLVKRVDVPDRALRKNAVLIESDELAEHCGGQPLQKNRIGRTIALKGAVGHEPVRRSLGADFLWRLAEGERLALGEDVCKQHVMLLAHRVQRLGEGDEVAEDQPGSLMDQLIKRMLAVGAGLTPKDWPGVAYDTVAVERYVLAVTIHRQLLEKAGKRFRILLVGEYADGLGAKEVGVPNRQQAHQHRKMALEGCGTKVLIDLVKTTEHRAEVFRTDSDHRRETDRRIHRVATDDPIPEREHVGGVDAERRHLGRIRRGGDKMSGDRSIAVVLEHFIDHHWSEIGAANADIHDVADPHVGMAFPYAVADLVGEIGHPVEHGVDRGHDILAINQYRCALGARSATCSTARCSETLIFSPRNMASIRARKLAASARSRSSLRVSAVMRFFE